MADTLQLLSIISFAVAGTCFLISVFLWFVFKIPNVIGDLSGRNAKKSIAKMRAVNEKTGIKKYKESDTNHNRGKLTSTIPDIDTKPKKSAKKTAKPIFNDRPETSVLIDNKATQSGSEETTLLDTEATALLDDEYATMSLDIIQRSPVRTGGKALTMINRVIFIHTDEVIEC